MISRLLYVDDSGSERSGMIVYGWIECEPGRWRQALRSLLELRKELYRDHLIPPAAELHATKFLNGRSRISLEGGDQDAQEWKTLGRAVAIYPVALLFAGSRWKVKMKHQHVLFWGGLRGALELALSMGLPEDMPQRNAIITVAFTVVAFSVFVQATTMAPLLRYLREIPAHFKKAGRG